jgi:hypothetical protein
LESSLPKATRGWNPAARQLPRTLRALGPDRAGTLKAELLEVARRFDVAEDDTLVLRVDYLEVVARTPSWR